MTTQRCGGKSRAVSRLITGNPNCRWQSLRQSTCLAKKRKNRSRHQRRGLGSSCVAALSVHVQPEDMPGSLVPPNVDTWRAQDATIRHASSHTRRMLNLVSIPKAGKGLYTPVLLSGYTTASSEANLKRKPTEKDTTPGAKSRFRVLGDTAASSEANCPT